MRLNELFVSHKQVEPIKIEPIQMFETTPLYANLKRAQQVATSAEEDTASTETPETSTADMSSWKVQSPEANSWKVNTTGTSTTPAESQSPTATSTGVPQTESGVTAGKSKQVERWNSIYRGNRDKWVLDMVAAYKRAGLSDNAIRCLIAKNAIESGWGRSAQGAYNFGNITTGKHWKGMFVKGKDTDGKGNSITNFFRAYNSLDEYVQDEIQFLTRLYDFDPNDNVNTFAHKLQGGNKAGRMYAGAPGYANAIISVYRNVEI